MEADVKEKYVLTVPRIQCYRAKWRTLTMITDSLEDHYSKLWAYVAKLRRTNRNGIFKIKVDRPTIEGKPYFHRFYVGFDALKRDWLAECRPIIGLDGCFLKTFLRGQLLCAVDRDGNNQIFSIAWAVVEDLEIHDGYGYIVISDQQKGLLNVVRKLIPHAKQINCARHIYANWKKVNPSDALKKWFWIAVQTTNQANFNDVIKEMQEILGKAVEDFMNQGPSHFCKTFINTFSRCDIVDNNLSETFNGYIVPTRHKHIIDMLKDIRVALMERMFVKKQMMLNSDDNICLRIRKKLEEAKVGSKACTPRLNGELKFEVRLIDEVYCGSQ
ncbi:uncharacterized protein [Elaeis guineensis]|uniref:uncharacterized protein n=1 Tax=Elaeis guineensis var. tenera TaxID=51953 RepID=UPI003C6D610C